MSSVQFAVFRGLGPLRLLQRSAQRRWGGAATPAHMDIFCGTMLSLFAKCGLLHVFQACPRRSTHSST